MPHFGNRSLENMRGVHPDLIKVLYEVIKLFDFSVLEGMRSFKRQERLVASGASRTLRSKHLTQPDGYSHAIDVVPYPVDWKDSQRFAYLAGLIIGVAKQMDVNIIWGHDWDGDGDFKEHAFKDSPHFQLEIKQ